MCCVAFGKRWSSLSVSLLMRTTLAPGPSRVTVEAVLVRVRGHRLHEWVVGSLHQSCQEAWAATDSSVGLSDTL